MHLGKYRHYKGKDYEVIGIARDCETHEMLVVYKALYTSEQFGDYALWVRKQESFLEHVEVDGQTLPRFAYLGE